MKTFPGLVDRHGVRQKISHGWNEKEVQIGRYYCDGYAEVDGRKFVFEYNGCAYHSCERCKQTRIHKNDEQKRIAFFRSLPNVKIVTTSSCEWYAEKCEINKSTYTPEISPLLFERTVKWQKLVSLVQEGRLYGFMVVDLQKTKSSDKWLRLNWLPVMQKAEILYEDLAPWMRNLYDPREFPKKTIVQRMQAKKLLLHTDLIRFYLENGFMVSKVHKVYEYQGAHCFQKVFKTVYEARVQATQTANDEMATDEMKAAAEMKATAVKLVSNSMYGSLLLVSLLSSQNYWSTTD